MKIDYLESPNEDVRIEIIPLIDIIFCILTFFILAAVGLTRQQAIDLDLPSANTGNALPPQGIGSEALQRQRLYVSVDAIGQVYIDQQPVTLNLLYDVLLQHQQVSPEGLIVLYASRDARYEDVIQVLDLLREVGGDRVALATLPGESLESPVPGLESPLPGQTVPSDDELINPSPFPSGAEPLSPGIDDPALQDRLQQVPTDRLETLPTEPSTAPDEAE